MDICFYIYILITLTFIEVQLSCADPTGFWYLENAESCCAAAEKSGARGLTPYTMGRKPSASSTFAR